MMTSQGWFKFRVGGVGVLLTCRQIYTFTSTLHGRNCNIQCPKSFSLSLLCTIHKFRFSFPSKWIRSHLTNTFDQQAELYFLRTLLEKCFKSFYEPRVQSIKLKFNFPQTIKEFQCHDLILPPTWCCVAVGAGVANSPLGHLCPTFIFSISFHDLPARVSSLQRRAEELRRG